MCPLGGGGSLVGSRLVPKSAGPPRAGLALGPGCFALMSQQCPHQWLGAWGHLLLTFTLSAVSLQLKAPHSMASCPDSKPLLDPWCSQNQSDTLWNKQELETPTRLEKPLGNCKRIPRPIDLVTTLSYL